MMVENFATRMHTVRILRGLSIDELSALSGVGIGTINRIERRKLRPGMPTIKKLAAGLGVSTDTLLGDNQLSKYKQKLEARYEQDS